MDNTVNHPSHYTDGKIEVIDFIEDKHLNYHRGNAVKYISRAGKKDPNKEIEDLQKAAWYIAREIERLKTSKAEQPAPADAEPWGEKDKERKDKFCTDVVKYAVCPICPLHSGNNADGTLCDDFVKDHPAEAREIMRKWEEEHK